MAMSAADRELHIKSTELLDSFINDGTVHVNEETEDKHKMIDLKEVEQFLSTKELSFMQSDIDTPSDYDINIGVFFLSTKNVVVPQKNCIDVRVKIRGNEDNRKCYIDSMGMKSGKLEKFMDLPKVNHGEDKMSAKAVVDLCNPSQIYNIYQDSALKIIRKLMSHAYFMFTGPNLYKREELNTPTLYVTYDKIRKKFKYAYNPNFILECAIDEWCLQGNRYNSLVDCYTYILAFMITHEMLHIIHHNSSSDGSGDLVDVGNHSVSNMVQDSFINCKIARRYIGANGIRIQGDLAPVPRIGIGSKMSFRAEHNNGFKKYEDEEDFMSKIGETILSVLKLDTSTKPNVSLGSFEENLNAYEGADVFINIDVNPAFSLVRGNGSGIFQVLVNELIKVITSGKVYDKYEKVSDTEKISDLDTIPDGTLVKVKGSGKICHVKNYNSDSKLYELTEAKVTGVRKVNVQGTELSVLEYSVSDNVYGTKRREQIKPYNPMDDAYTENDTQKKDKLSQEDLNQAKVQNAMAGMGAGMSSALGNAVQPKNLKVGDIVYIKRLKKFGRITLASNGKFNLEEMQELPAKIIDVIEG